jgi:hypothetical protein
LAAAKGVPFLAPLKPSIPEEDQTRQFPVLSVSTTLVLLYVDSTYNLPVETFFLGTRLKDLGFPDDPSPPFLTIRFFPILLLVFRFSGL